MHKHKPAESKKLTSRDQCLRDYQLRNFEMILNCLMDEIESNMSLQKMRAITGKKRTKRNKDVEDIAQCPNFH